MASLSDVVVNIVSRPLPRRVQIDRLTPAERVLVAAVEAVEALPADPRLTDAVEALQVARARVADYVDGIDGGAGPRLRAHADSSAAAVDPLDQALRQMPERLGANGVTIRAVPDFDETRVAAAGAGGAGDPAVAAEQGRRRRLRPYRDIVAERRRQDARWGGPAVDDAQALGEWAGKVHRKVGELHDAARQEDDHEARRVLVQIGALAVAAVELLDRRTTRAILEPTPEPAAAPSDLVLAVRQTIAATLNVDIQEVTAGANINRDLGADSLDNVELLMALEERFRLEFQDEEARGVRTVRDAVAVVAAALKAQGRLPVADEDRA